LRKALDRDGRPERIVINGSQTNREGDSCAVTGSQDLESIPDALKPIRIQQSAYLDNRIGRDHLAVKRRVRPMLGFKSMCNADFHPVL
jgi:putative transposase